MSKPKTKTPRTDEVAAEYYAGWQQKYEAMKFHAEELEIELGKGLGTILAEDEDEE